MVDRQKVVKTILGLWIKQNYDSIMPYLDEKVVYTVAEGAARSICHTPGVFRGKAKVQLWYNSHSLIAAMYGKNVINPLCGAVRPPQVVTYEDTSQDMVIAVGTVALGVPNELPCMWTSLWQFKGDLIGSMQLTADSVAGIAQFEASRREVFLAAQRAELRKA